VRRSQSLPFGGTVDPRSFAPLCQRLAVAAETARARGELARDGYADELWLHSYAELSEGKPGLLGAILGRGEAQVMRLALIYALVDGSSEITRPHLEAALALWRYCEASARYVFGDSLGDPDADHLHVALLASPDGLTQTEIHVQVFQKHKSKQEIARMLSRLVEYGRARSTIRPTEGRNATVWHARGSISVPADEPGQDAAPGEVDRERLRRWLVLCLRVGDCPPDQVVRYAQEAGFAEAAVRREIAESELFEEITDSAGELVWHYQERW
jgi:hypothetical protein